MTAKYLLSAGVAAVLLMGSQAMAQDQASKKFVTEAIQGNLAEVEMGKLAQKNGGSEGVKSFGQMLEKDHSAANDKAMAAAKSVGVTAPTAPNAKQKSEYDMMSKLNGAAFDKQFSQHMVADHKKDISEYQKESKKSDAVGSYAKETLPTLQKHLQTAQSLTTPKTTGKR